LSAPTDNQIHAVPANQFSPSAGTTLIGTALKIEGGQQKLKIVRSNRQSNFTTPIGTALKIEGGQQKLKIVRSNRQSNLQGFLPIIFLPLLAP